MDPSEPTREEILQTKSTPEIEVPAWMKQKQLREAREREEERDRARAVARDGFEMGHNQGTQEVMLRFSEPTYEIIMDARMAVQVAGGLRKHAKAATGKEVKKIEKEAYQTLMRTLNRKQECFKLILYCLDNPNVVDLEAIRTIVEEGIKV